MALTMEVKNLLDKLYNLRGEDSIILNQMEKEKQEAEVTKVKTSEQKRQLQEQINKLTAEEGLLKTQGQRLREVLSGINQDDFSVVLEKLKLDFNPKDLANRLNIALPETINKVVTEATKAEEEFNLVDQQMNDAITKIEELAIRRDTAMANQEKLNEYFKLALSGNINITRESIASLLEQFDFSLEDQKESAKILMFPEDALYEYDNDLKENENKGKSISEVIAEARDYQTFNKPESILEEKKNEPSRDDLIELLKRCGLEQTEFSYDDLDRILKDYDNEYLRNNIEYIKNKGIAIDIFTDNISLLTDKELSKKLDKIFALGKTPIDIYLNPSVLIKYNYQELCEAINLLERNGLDPKKVPLMAY